MDNNYDKCLVYAYNKVLADNLLHMAKNKEQKKEKSSDDEDSEGKTKKADEAEDE